MSRTALNELPFVFDARRVKAPDLRGLDAMVNGARGWVHNRRPMLRRLRQQAQRIEKLESQVHELGSTRFAEEVQRLRSLARVGSLREESRDMAMAMAREAALRATGLRPFPVQIMGRLAPLRPMRSRKWPPARQRR